MLMQRYYLLAYIFIVKLILFLLASTSKTLTFTFWFRCTTAFGAFVDIGVHQDGLVHISQMADHYIKDPNEVVHLNQKVRVKVLEVDVNRNRISLTMKL